MSDRRIIYVGQGDRRVFDIKEHQYIFKTGVVYPVSDMMFNYLKAFRGFHEVKEIKLGTVDFKKYKKVLK